MSRGPVVATLRIAWREVRRNRGRSALVVAMIGLPVLVLTSAIVVSSTTALTPEDHTRIFMGAADLRVEGDPAAVRALLTELPPEATVAHLDHVGWPVPADLIDGPVDTDVPYLEVVSAPLEHPLLAGKLMLVDGRAPVRAGEAAISPAMLRLLDADVGDVVALSRPAVTLTVTGTVVNPYATRDLRIAIPEGGLLEEPWSAVGIEGSYGIWLVSTGGLPPGVVRDRLLEADASQPLRVGEVEPSLVQVTTRSEAQDWMSGGNGAVSFLFVAGGLALFEAALIAAAAFAIGARRQQRSLGLLAASGGRERDLRRVVVGGGLLLGLIASSGGVAVGLIVARVSTPLFEAVTGRLIDGLRVPVGQVVGAGMLGLVAALIAAWIPARTAARVPTLEALAGRRPIRSGSAKSVAIGAATILAGAAVVTSGARPPTSTWGILIGTILVVTGFAAASPALVALTGRPAARTPTSMRLALRDAARHRTRTGPAVAATMAALSLPIALSMFTLSADAHEAARYIPGLRDDQLSVSSYSTETGWPVEPDRSTLDGVNVALPGSVSAPLRLATVDVEHAAGAAVDGTHTVWVEGGMHTDWRDGPIGSTLAIGDEQLLHAIGVDDVPPGFRSGEIVALGVGATDDGYVTVRGFDEAIDPFRAPAVEVDVPELAGLPRFVISEAAAEQLGFGARFESVLVRSAAPLTAQDRAALHLVLAGDPSAYIMVEQPPIGAPASLRLIALLASALAALGIVAIATALNLTEARDDLATLGAIGASPRIRRTLTAVQAGSLATIGAVLAIPAGIVPAVAVIVARGGEYPIIVPWLAIAVVVAVVPVLAAVGGALLTRSRLVLRPRLA